MTVLCDFCAALMMEAASTSKTSVNFYQFIFILAAVTT
jgi:hypothetical protein